MTTERTERVDLEAVEARFFDERDVGWSWASQKGKRWIRGDVRALLTELRRLRAQHEAYEATLWDVLGWIDAGIDFGPPTNEQMHRIRGIIAAALARTDGAGRNGQRSAEGK